jgi:hypothetical protein
MMVKKQAVHEQQEGFFLSKGNGLSYFMPLGMLGVIFYVTHTTLGNVLWSDYNPITTDISSLTAVGAPNRELLVVLTSLYGICMLLFVGAMIVRSFREYHLLVRTAYIILFIMQLTSLFGYSLFPLEGDKTVMTLQNQMHIVVTVIVVFTTIASGFFLAVGYIKQEKLKQLGRLVLVFAILITGFGVLNPLNMALGWNILGLTERLVIYTLQVLLFILSFLYTWKAEQLK